MFYSASVGKPVPQRGYRCYKSGLPAIFGSEIDRDFRLGNKDSLRVILSLLQISRAIPAWKKIDLSSITEPSKIKNEILKEFSDNIEELFHRLPLKSEKPMWEKLHIATTMGPIGPTLVTCGSLVNKFLDRFKHLSSDFNFTDLVSYLDKVKGLSPHWNKIYPNSGLDILRRLSTVPDVDGKTRVIGIVDYFSQSVLKNLHTDLMETLRSLGGPRGPDVTFGQDIKPFGPRTEPYYSIDLTAATDRFPVEITRIVLEHMYDYNYSMAWKELMIGEPFWFDQKEYKYSAGQPMGAYSSWPSFSVSHHFIVQFAALRIGLPKFKDYKLLGDDIVIRNKLVAESYIKIMHDLGVEISPHKTLISDDSFEFAKRFFYKGDEVTGYPINGLYKTLGSFTEFVSVTREANRRGFILPYQSSYNCVCELFTSLRSLQIKGFELYSNSFIRRLNRKMLVLWWLQDRGSDVFLLRKIFDLYKVTVPCSWNDSKLKLFSLECIAQNKINALLDGVRAQVKRINSFMRGLSAKISSQIPEFSDLDPGDIPMIRALISNWNDQQGQVENIRELAKQSPPDFERLVFDELLIPEIDPEILDSSRRSLRLLFNESQMAVKGFLLISNLERERNIELAQQAMEDDTKQYPDTITLHPAHAG
jgi:hypothetical protein